MTSYKKTRKDVLDLFFKQAINYTDKNLSMGLVLTRSSPSPYPKMDY